MSGDRRRERFKVAARAERWSAAHWKTAVGQLIGATQRARAAGRRVVLVTGPAPVDRVLAVSGVARTVETTPDPATLDN
jgi:hypothetical protein